MAAVEEKEVETQGAGQTSPPQTPSEKETPPKATGSEEKNAGTEAAPPVSLHKVKIDGEEREVPLEELIRGYQLDKTSYKRFEEASQLKKSADTFLEMFSRDARETMLRGLAAKNGGDKTKAREELRQLAVAEVKAMMEEEGMAPELRQAREKEAALSEREQEIRSREEEIERRSFEAQAKAQEAQIDSELPEAMKKAGIEVYADSPKEKEKREGVIKAAILQVWQWADQNGVQMSFEDCAREVKRQRTQSASEYAQSLSPDEFKKVFAKQYEAIRKQELDALRNGSSGSTSQAATPKRDAAARRPGRPDPKSLSMSEYSRQLAEYLENSA